MTGDKFAQASSEVRIAATDARRTVLQCFEAIQNYPLEIYHSALVWLPKMSRILAKLGGWQQWQVVCGGSYSWNACESILGGHLGYVTSVAFSQDGKRIVSGSSDKTV